MDYKTLRKNYRLYIRSAGVLAMLLIICVGFVVRDTLLQTAGLLLVLAGLFFSSNGSRRATPKSATPCCM